MYADYSKIQIDKTIKNLTKVLDQQELNFIRTQEEIYQEKLQKNVDMALKLEERSITLLKKCKEWGGPWTEFQEFQASVKKIKDQEKLRKILRTEILYKKLLCPKDFERRKDLYKVNKMTLAQMKENLTVLLSTEVANPDTDCGDLQTILEKLNSIIF